MKCKSQLTFIFLSQRCCFPATFFPEAVTANFFKEMKKRFFVVAAIIFSSQLHAQQDSIATPLDEVVLTANKYPRKQSETGKVITIITRQGVRSTNF